MPHERRSARPGSAGVGNPAPNARAVPKGVFRKEGEYWTVGYSGRSLRLKDSKGLGYIAHLLRHPTVEFHVLDLAGGIAGRGDDDEAGQSAQGLPRGDKDLEQAGIHIGNLGDAGEMLDEQAKAAYRRRLSDLREELEEAKKQGNVERAEQAEQEIEVLTGELSRAVGLGGRNRRAASASERARQSIGKTIKAVLERIAQSDGALADILSRCIKTGTYCFYQPDSEFPIAWEFAPTAIETPEQPTEGSDPAPARADRLQSLPLPLEVSPFSVAERTAFVGRDTERAAIREAVDRALSGRGSVVMLGGGAGVGKSRLAMEMAQNAAHKGFRCFAGHCYERDEPFPFLPFAEMIESSLAQASSLDSYRQLLGENAAELAQIVPSLRRVFPDIPPSMGLPPAQQRRYVFQSFSEALARSARIRPQLDVLEDLHWADESTLGLLIHLAHRVAQLPVVIIGTYRDGSAENQALVRTLEELIRLGVRPMKLGGLSKDAVAQILNDLSERQTPERLVSLIFEESQGNPFFVEEVFRHLREEGKVFDATGQFRPNIEIDESDVPENVRLVIGRRLERFDAQEKRVLAAAAVIGRSFSFQLLTAICRIDVDELFAVIEKAQQMGIIVPSSEGPERPFTFAHELTRQTLLAHISPPRRQHFHALVADAIERVYPGAANEHAGEIADHLLKAGSFSDASKLVRGLTLAGKVALQAAAFEEARRSFRSALSHQGGVEAGETAELLTSLAMAELGLDQLDAALAHLREVVEIYSKLDDREMVARGFARLTGALNMAGRFQEAIETANRGLGYLGTDVSAVRVRLLAALGQACVVTAGYETAHEALREGFNLASQLSDPNLEARLLGVRSTLNFHYFRLKEAAADELRSEQLGASEASPWRRALQLRNLTQTFLYLGRFEEALKIADELEPLAKKIGQAYEVAVCVSMRAWAEFAKAPDLAKLEIGFKQVPKSDQVQWFAYWGALSEVQLSLLDFFRGSWTSALLHAQGASGQPELESSVRGYGAGTLFRQMAYAGDRDGALGILEEKQTQLPHSGKPNAAGSWFMLALVIEGLVMLGEQEKAAQLYPLVCELVDTEAVVLWSISRFTRTTAGIAAAAARQWQAAEHHFRIAMEQAESFPNLLEQAEIRRFHAMMLQDRGDPGDREKAQTLLIVALESYSRIGMPRHIKMARALLS
jgi:tetratricopeptide (TPR) repeat protein